MSIFARNLLPKLINLDEDKTHDDVHHGGVELEAEVGWTSVKYSTHQTLKNIWFYFDFYSFLI